jgi:exodeoxyribonuclease V
MTISPSATQNEAIKAIVDWYGRKGQQEFYLAGFAGTGKSTIVEFAVEEIKKKYKIKHIATAAYTGKAASVLRRKGNKDAQTIHSLIYTPTVDKKTGQVSFALSEESEAAKAELLVLDECSMVDEPTAKDLRSFGKKILIMGDPGQLPPVNGQGAFTNRTPDVFLHEIHRQVAGSPILELATLARRGEPIPNGYHQGNVRVMLLTKDTQPLIYSPDTQPLCGLNRVRWTYTQRIRTLLRFEGRRPLPTEKIICCRNNRSLGFFNGGSGVLNDLKSEFKGSKGSWEIDVKMDDHQEPKTGVPVDPYHFDNHFMSGSAQRLQIPKKRFEEFDWGYVLTCHKAQGSSWDHVTIIDDSGSFKENRNLWLYTAITRAENGLTLLTRQ